LLYELNADFTPIKKGGEYLDPAAALEAIAAVANQGKR
jgi:2,3-bisphosphoglycerate-dependent phosphoglycerate mutase